MTITGGSALPKDDIDRMMREADQFAEEDKGRREEAESRNRGEQLAYQTEKFLADDGDKVGADEKAKVTSALDDLKKALDGEDTTAIRTATESLATASQAMGASLYANQAAAGGPEGTAAPGSGAGTAGQAGDDDVVDAEIVDEPREG